MSTQFVLGLLLWAWLSPYGAAGLADVSATMSSPTRRFWAVEHVVMMLVSVGVAQSLVEVRVVDAAGQPLPTGETGEVVVRGDTVMPGYWNNPNATAQTLQGGWLYTGKAKAMVLSPSPIGILWTSNDPAARARR